MRRREDHLQCCDRVRAECHHRAKDAVCVAATLLVLGNRALDPRSELVVLIDQPPPPPSRRQGHHSTTTENPRVRKSGVMMVGCVRRCWVGNCGDWRSHQNAFFKPKDQGSCDGGDLTMAHGAWAWVDMLLKRKKGKYSAFCDDRAEVDREEQKSRKVQS